MWLAVNGVRVCCFGVSPYSSAVINVILGRASWCLHVHACVHACVHVLNEVGMVLYVITTILARSDGREAGVSNPQMEKMKTFFRAFTILLIPITAQFPTVRAGLLFQNSFQSVMIFTTNGGTFTMYLPQAGIFFSVLYSPSIVSFWTVLIMLSPQGLFMYWLPSSIYSIAQILLLKLPPVKSRLGIPDTITTPSHTKTAASSKGFFQMVKDSKSMTPYLLISTVSGTFSNSNVHVQVM